MKSAWLVGSRLYTHVVECYRRRTRRERGVDRYFQCVATDCYHAIPTSTAQVTGLRTAGVTRCSSPPVFIGSSPTGSWSWHRSQMHSPVQHIAV